MSKIVYGVSGEGSGHSSRARVVAGHLVSQGHVVKIVSYDRGVRNLSDSFDVFETEGLHIASEDNKVSVVKTFTDNLSRLSEGHRKLRELKKELFEAFKPDCVLTDFEPMTAYLAHHYGIPLISVDNQHRMRYMEYPYPPDQDTDRHLTKTIIRAMVPRPDVSLVTSFYPGKPTNDRTHVFPPILRQEVLERTPSDGEHILVYASFGFESLLDILKTFTRERFRIYGANEADEDVAHFTFCPFDVNRFLDDLASAKAVMATAGFSLMTESLYYHKPLMACPMQGQYEQAVNGHLLEVMQLGMNVAEVSPDTVASFLYHLPDYQQGLEDYSTEGNSAILSKLDTLLANDAAEAHAYRRRRKGLDPSDV
ncbi:MAG: hypothetical protein MI922_19855 [Bacteroidales bacterium]|nr:hypothetical protein [Bacteroidales bacterium]